MSLIVWLLACVAICLLIGLSVCVVVRRCLFRSYWYTCVAYIDWPVSLRPGTRDVRAGGLRQCPCWLCPRRFYACCAFACCDVVGRLVCLYPLVVVRLSRLENLIAPVVVPSCLQPCAISCTGLVLLRPPWRLVTWNHPWGLRRTVWRTFPRRSSREHPQPKWCGKRMLRSPAWHANLALLHIQERLNFPIFG